MSFTQAAVDAITFSFSSMASPSIRIPMPIAIRGCAIRCNAGRSGHDRHVLELLLKGVELGIEIRDRTSARSGHAGKPGLIP